MYWAKYFPKIPCDVILTCIAAPLAPSWHSLLLNFWQAQQNMHKGKHKKEGASSQLKVEYFQH